MAKDHRTEPAPFEEYISNLLGLIKGGKRISFGEQIGEIVNQRIRGVETGVVVQAQGQRDAEWCEACKPLLSILPEPEIIKAYQRAGGKQVTDYCLMTFKIKSYGRFDTPQFAKSLVQSVVTEFHRRKPVAKKQQPKRRITKTRKAKKNRIKTKRQ